MHVCLAAVMGGRRVEKKEMLLCLFKSPYCPWKTSRWKKPAPRWCRLHRAPLARTFEGRGRTPPRHLPAGARFPLPRHPHRRFPPPSSPPSQGTPAPRRHARRRPTARRRRCGVRCGRGGVRCQGQSGRGVGSVRSRVGPPPATFPTDKKRPLV